MPVLILKKQLISKELNIQQHAYVYKISVTYRASNATGLKSYFFTSCNQIKTVCKPTLFDFLGTLNLIKYAHFYAASNYILLFMCVSTLRIASKLQFLTLLIFISFLFSYQRRRKKKIRYRPNFPTSLHLHIFFSYSTNNTIFDSLVFEYTTKIMAVY